MLSKEICWYQKQIDVHTKIPEDTLITLYCIYYY